MHRLAVNYHPDSFRGNVSVMNNPTQCQCSESGYCTLMRRGFDPPEGRLMSPARWEECSNADGQHAAWFPMFLSEITKERPATASDSQPCIHRGEENGRIECPSCSGMVQVKTFDCAVHGSCTLGKRLDEMACCVGCGDYSDE